MDEVVLRLEELLFPSIADVAVVAVDVENETVRVEARSTASGSACPGCRNWSSRVHSFYLRFPADVPSAGLRVVLCLRVRRFASCSRQTFVEQVPGLTRRYGRWTERLRSTLASVGLALAGRAGARMAGVFGVTVSRSMVLRLIEALPEPEPPTVRVVGVDEYATRKGRHFGTVLVDVETRRPVDLLPDREASSLAAWLAERPGIEVVCRDRAPFFAEGATAGHLKRCRSRTAGTSGTTSAKPLNGVSPTIGGACAALRPSRPGRSRNRKNPAHKRPKFLVSRALWAWVGLPVAAELVAGFPPGLLQWPAAAVQHLTRNRITGGGAGSVSSGAGRAR
ncbi:transposase [Streptomyces sp. NBC_00872]|uniref:transposase n=1 Tax=Streptomyces sp. NBC_00872 TaxID=2903686 RepID=UPI00386A0FBC|nr:transposase [Streptomyces sp. NBC_00872]